MKWMSTPYAPNRRAQRVNMTDEQVVRMAFEQV